MPVATKDLIRLDGVAPSTQMRAELAALGLPVLVSISRGRDSVAAALALIEAGVDIRLFHMSHIPGMPLLEQSLDDLREALGREILDLPHPDFYKWLRYGAYQPPERRAQLEQIHIPEADYGTVHDQVCAHYGLDPAETYTALGTRSAESNRRRDGLKKVGTAYNDEFGTAAVIWDWRQHHADEIIARHGLQLPPDYELFLLRDEETGRLVRRGRSFDGIDAFFTRPLAAHRPDDWALLRRWFPLADLDHLRSPVRRRSGDRNRALSVKSKEAQQRLHESTQTEHWATISFDTAEHLDRFCQRLDLNPDDDWYLPGAALEAAVADRELRRIPAGDITASRALPPGDDPPGDPTAPLVSTGDVQADERRRTDLILAALEDADGTYSGPWTVDSPHWIAVYWPTRVAKEAWLRDLGRRVGWIGEKYLDGNLLARSFDLEGARQPR